MERVHVPSTVLKRIIINSINPHDSLAKEADISILTLQPVSQSQHLNPGLLAPESSFNPYATLSDKTNATSPAGEHFQDAVSLEKAAFRG